MTESSSLQPQEPSEAGQDAQKPFMSVIDTNTYRPVTPQDVTSDTGVRPASRESVDALIGAAQAYQPDPEKQGLVPDREDSLVPDHHGISKRVQIAGGVAAATIALGGAALVTNQMGVFGSDSSDEAHVQIVPAPTQPAVIPGTEIPNPLKTPEVTAIPTPKTGFSEKDGAFSYITEKGETLNVPQIDGLTAKLVKVGDTEEVQYFAKEGNQYGIEANKSVGEYTPNVDIYENSQRKELGGVSLSSQVVQKLLGEKIDQTPSQADKWGVALPVDPRNLAQGNKILLSFENAETVPIKIAKLSFDGQLPVSDIILNQKNIKFLTSPYYNWAFIDNVRSVSPYGDTIYPGKEMSYITVAGHFIDANQKVVSSNFGDTLAVAQDKVYVWYTASNESRDMSRDKILSVGDSIPVFMQSSDLRK